VSDVKLFGEPWSIWDHWDIAMVRDLPEWVAPRVDLPCVQFGGGHKHIDGWENWDWPKWNAENRNHVITEYGNGTVGGIACYHTLDHLSPDGVINALAEFQRILAPGAAATIVVPHHMSTLAAECIQHKTRYGIDTWRNIFSERQYTHFHSTEWQLRVGFNMIMGIAERNLVQITQLIKDA